MSAKKVVEANHGWQPRKKRYRQNEYAIMTFCFVTNLYKKGSKAQQQFFEDPMLYICKGYMALSICENIWLWMIMLG
jgi:hypothetical protein